jgi:hypothetical protein
MVRPAAACRVGAAGFTSGPVGCTDRTSVDWCRRSPHGRRGAAVGRNARCARDRWPVARSTAGRCREGERRGTQVVLAGAVQRCTRSGTGCTAAPAGDRRNRPELGDAIDAVDDVLGVLIGRAQAPTGPPDTQAPLHAAVIAPPLHAGVARGSSPAGSRAETNHPGARSAPPQALSPRRPADGGDLLVSALDRRDGLAITRSGHALPCRRWRASQHF